MLVKPEIRDRFIHIRVSDSELAIIQAVARKLSRTQSDLLRIAVLGAAAELRLAIPESKAGDDGPENQEHRSPA